MNTPSQYNPMLKTINKDCEMLIKILYSVWYMTIRLFLDTLGPQAKGTMEALPGQQHQGDD